MKVTICSNFDPGASEIVLSGEQSPLRSLLEELSRRNWRKIRFIDPRTDKVDDFFTVLVNGKDWRSLPQDIETMLQDGDEVQVDVITFMGGNGE